MVGLIKRGKVGRELGGVTLDNKETMGEFKYRHNYAKLLEAPEERDMVESIKSEKAGNKLAEVMLYGGDTLVDFNKHRPSLVNLHRKLGEGGMVDLTKCGKAGKELGEVSPQLSECLTRGGLSLYRGRRPWVRRRTRTQTLPTLMQMT